jgi:uncharacterized protein YjiS (DUF1127 family)
VKPRWIETSALSPAHGRTDVARGKVGSQTAANSSSGRIMDGIFGLVSLWRARARARAEDRRLLAELAALDDHTLRDIGINWDHLHREASKPFWRA